MRPANSHALAARFTVETLAAFALVAALAAPARADEIPLETLLDAVRQPPLGSLAWSPDGAVIAGILREDPPADDADAKQGEAKRPSRFLLAFDSATGAEIWRQDLAKLREAAAADEPGTKSPPTLEAFVLPPQGQDLLLKGDRSLFLWTPGSSEVRRLGPVAPDESGAEAEVENPGFSPNGSKVAFVRANDLWVVDIASGVETRLTSDGAENEILNGKTDWIYWEELWNRDSTGFWWAPDGRALAFYRFDERQVPTYPILDETGIQVEIREQRYPKPGEPNPTVRVSVVDLETRTIRDLDTGDPARWYLARIHWRPDARAIAVERLNREQNKLDLLFCEPESGACSEVATQTHPTWINLADDFRFLPDGSFLWSDEASGWRDLARYDGLGRKRVDLLPDSWVLDAVAGLVEAAGEVIVTAHRKVPLGAATRQVLALHLSGKRNPRILADGDGSHSALVDDTTGAWVDTRSGASRAPARTLRRLDGSEIADLPAFPALPPEIDALPDWELFELDAPSGARLPARLLKPADFDPGRRYPVIMFHYGGPGSQVVVDRWGGIAGLWHRWMASRGYVVLSVDNEASIFFGKAGEDRVHRRFGELELAGQRAGVAWLAAQGWADTSRIGLWGWSGGGSNTLYSLLHSPGTWRAGVAGAPVTDWRLYDSIWTERYLGTPEANPDGYRDSSPITAAAELADALLVVHGTGDDNVHPQNTIALLEQLVAADRPFEVAVYPNQKHGLRGQASRHFYRRMTEFFDRHLRLCEAPTPTLRIGVR